MSEQEREQILEPGEEKTGHMESIEQMYIKYPDGTIKLVNVAINWDEYW